MNEKNQSDTRSNAGDGSGGKASEQIRETIEELTGRLGTLLPPGASQLKTDFENNARAALQGALGKMDLVTREEFDIQQRVLQKTRSKLEALEKRLEQLAADSGSNNSGSSKS